jgi:hypothetical protein
MLLFSFRRSGHGTRCVGSASECVYRLRKPWHARPPLAARVASAQHQAIALDGTPVSMNKLGQVALT